MKQSAGCEPALRELIGTDLPAHELERLARADSLLRAAVRHSGHRVGRPPATGQSRADSRAAGEDAHRSARDMNRIYHRAGTRHSRDCERTRASISAALDCELPELESIRMREHVEDCVSCGAFQADAERVSASLRTAPLEPLPRPLEVPSRRRAALPLHERPTDEEAGRPTLSLVTTPRATTGSTPHSTDEERYELKLSFGELALVYKSLQAAKTLAALPPQDELLNDTLQLVDQALNRAI
jgi:Putative zinc-finger